MGTVSFLQGRSLSGKLLRILLSLTTVAVLALFLVLELDFYRGERARLVESLARLVNVQGAAVVDAVWEFDLERMRALLVEQSRLSFFQAAEVIGKGGEILVSVGDTATPPRSPDFRLEYPLRHQSASGMMIIGKLVVTVHDDGIRAVMIQHLKVNGAILLTLLVALAAGTLVGVRIVIGRPLEEFRGAIERPMEVQIETPLQWSRDDELGKVLGAYNVMLEARNQAEIATRQREAELREAARIAQEANAESARFNRLAIGREMRIIELKNHLNDLAKSAGQPLPFDRLQADDLSFADTPATEDVGGKNPLELLLGTTDVQSLFKNFCNAVGVASAIIDLEGKVLVAARWQRACTDFHRVNEVTCTRCIESDTHLSSRLQEGQNYTIYRCRNGLTDAASPIMVNGQHLANVFIGQFLVAPPDTAFFATQAREVGFNEVDYLAAIAEAPVIAEEKLPSILSFLSHFSNLLATLSMERNRTATAQISLRQGTLAALNLAEDTELARKELSAYKDQLEEMVAERTQELRASEERMRSIIENAADGIVVIGSDGTVQSFSPAAERIFGYSANEIIGRNVCELMPHSTINGPDGTICHDLTSRDSHIIGTNRETIGRHKDGREFPMDLAVGEATLGDERIFTGILRDISERIKIQTERDKAMELISSSIQYASRIQRSVLPSSRAMERTFADYFVLWEPRDVVGGDMYWCHSWGNGVLMAMGDCTGHGVPGAFMTLIANGALEQSLLETRPGDQATLIQRMHQLIQFSLGQDQEEKWTNQGDASDDGLEVGVCFINIRQKKVTFSGARFSLFVAEAGTIREIKGDKTGIGYRGIDRDRDFTSHEIELNPEKRFYMTSDGILDQVGGDKGLGFGKRRFTQLLADVWEMPMAQQKEQIQQALTDYQGNQGRRDDVSVIGFQGQS
ncbi:MAG: PocR ligand-binding domain-containing protein [Nitrospirae bacterium]|nr:PocR ligand-binding domain-containing protein [Magnetococcales bacterium]HAT49410.1 hypothetical protein [Alphaproteobacteria bacterium]